MPSLYQDVPPGAAPRRPQLRGRLHQVAFVVALPAGIALVVAASAADRRVAAAIFALSLVALYGVSAAFHRRAWSPSASRRMQQLDHAMIFVLIAGSYTPICLVTLDGPWRASMLTAAWTGAALGVGWSLLGLDRPRGLGLGLYLTLGWLIVVAFPQVMPQLSGVQIGLLAGGGLFYTVGAISLAVRRPDPFPLVFGYHEVWHALTIAAGLCHFLLIWSLVTASSPGQSG
jgi:hemolysin III